MAERLVQHVRTLARRLDRVAADAAGARALTSPGLPSCTTEIPEVNGRGTFRPRIGMPSQSEQED
jgi:hypothetical protein